MSDHTPGPWTIYTEHQSMFLPIVNYTGTALAFLPVQHPDMTANAHLMSAAPELLNQLQWITEFMDKTDFGQLTDQVNEWRKRAEYAIKKATGQL